MRQAFNKNWTCTAESLEGWQESRWLAPKVYPAKESRVANTTIKHPGTTHDNGLGETPFIPLSHPDPIRAGMMQAVTHRPRRVAPCRSVSQCLETRRNCQNALWRLRHSATRLGLSVFDCTLPSNNIAVFNLQIYLRLKTQQAMMHFRSWSNVHVLQNRCR